MLQPQSSISSPLSLPAFFPAPSQPKYRRQFSWLPKKYEQEDSILRKKANNNHSLNHFIPLPTHGTKYSLNQWNPPWLHFGISNNDA
jgi:hypothetical protein